MTARTSHILALTVSDFTEAPTAPHFALADCACGWTTEASTQTIPAGESPAEWLLTAWRSHAVSASFLERAAYGR